jgi:hypothetical protein
MGSIAKPDVRCVAIKSSPRHPSNPSTFMSKSSSFFRMISGVTFALAVLLPGIAQTSADAGSSAPLSNPDEVVKLETLQVTGTALRSQEEVEKPPRGAGYRRHPGHGTNSANLADENLADALIRAAGREFDADALRRTGGRPLRLRARHPGRSELHLVRRHRRCSPPPTTATACAAWTLNLIPTQISRTTRVYKSFTADLDGGRHRRRHQHRALQRAQGPAHRQHPGAADQRDRPRASTFPVFNSAAATTENRPGVRGPVGAVCESFWPRWARFGVVLSGIYRQRDYSYTKTNPNGRVFLHLHRHDGGGQPLELGRQASVSDADLPPDGLHENTPRPTAARPSFEYRTVRRLVGCRCWASPTSSFEDQEPRPILSWSSSPPRPRPSDRASADLKVGPCTATVYSYDRFSNRKTRRPALFKLEGKAQHRLPRSSCRAGFLPETNSTTGTKTATFLYSPPASFITFRLQHSALFPQGPPSKNADADGHTPRSLPAELGADRTLSIRTWESKAGPGSTTRRTTSADSTGFGYTTGRRLGARTEARPRRHHHQLRQQQRPR